MIQDKFNFFVECETFEKAGADGKKEMRVGGIASTAEVDRQGEELIPTGFDYSYFLNSGFFNYHHQSNKNPEAVIGEPDKVEMRPQGMYVEGFLYKSSDMAKSVYKQIHTLKKDSKTRRMGFSIEGKVIERDPMNPAKILKSKITGCAITMSPINGNTLCDILKAWDGDEKMEVGKVEDNMGSGGETMVLSPKIHGDIVIKATENGDIEITTEKAMSVGSASGQAVAKEDLEGGVRPVNDISDKKKKDNQFSKSEAYEYIFSKHPDMSPEEAVELVNKIIEEKQN